MAFSLKNGFSVSGWSEESFLRKPRGVSLISSSFSFPNLRDSKSPAFPSLKIDFPGKSLVFSDQKGWPPNKVTLHAQASGCISRSLRWWEKNLQPNMIEIQSAQNLVDSLLLAGDKLVVVDFYSPGCGGCKALHPKICQFAEANPEAIFLKVNFEELKTLCHGLHIHVLPFFRFYRGAEGRLCSFSCTNATIKKFKAALGKHGTDRCSVGPTKGLDEAELKNLESVGEISRKDSKFVFSQKEIFNDLALKNMDLSLSGAWKKKKMDMEEESAAL